MNTEIYTDIENYKPFENEFNEQAIQRSPGNGHHNGTTTNNGNHYGWGTTANSLPVGDVTPLYIMILLSIIIKFAINKLKR